MINRGVDCFEGAFNRAQAFTTTPGQDGWTIADTSSSGTPTYVLAFDLAQIQFVEMVALVAGIDSVTALTFGVGSARNSTDDSVTINAWFRMQGSASTTAVVCETDDNTTDNDDKATGVTLAAVYKTFKIDFMNGLADVRFYIDGERVAAATTFSMTGITAGQNVQPIVQLSKASGTGVPSVTIARFKIQYRYAFGA
jgi:hypothetical protein